MRAETHRCDFHPSILLENELDLSPLSSASLAIQIHVICAVPALVLGPVALFRASRDIWHKVAGRVWALSMIGLAGSSLFIHEARMFGPFSPIHLLSVITFIGPARSGARPWRRPVRCSVIAASGKPRRWAIIAKDSRRRSARA